MTNRLIILLLLLCGTARAQAPAGTYLHNLSKRVSVDVKHERVSDVLSKMSKAGDFYFAYNGALFKQDSLVNLNMRNAPVRDVLDQMFEGKVDYKENAEYIILRSAEHHLTIEPENITTADNLYLISGYVVDTRSGRKVKQASVYEKRLLQSTLTDNDGYFKLRFKGEHKEVILTASKENYRDTALVFLADINIKPESYNDPDKEKGSRFSNAIEQLGIGRFFISSRQRIQNMNIPNFFANTPFQASLTPGLSSHGMMSSKVVNKVSLNILGGYSAGVDGFEMAGVFNLTKGEVHKVQVAGVFNAVGGSVKGLQMAGVMNDIGGGQQGFQIAGVFNNIHESADGMQMAGVGNFVRKDMNGVQFAGLGNIVSANTDGFQMAGLTNITSKNFRGVQFAGLGNIVSRNSGGFQLAGLGNITSRQSRGVQFAGLFNYARENKGFQFGLINISDKSTGTSLGLINFVGNGYHKISLSTNELINANVAYKMGNANLYNILLAGKNFSDSARVETFGLGFGHDFIFNKRLSVATELTFQYLYLGSWKYANTLTRFQANLQVQIFNGLTLFGGPVYSYYNTDAPAGFSVKGYKQQVYPDKHHNFGGNNKGWFGWNVGITLF